MHMNYCNKNNTQKYMTTMNDITTISIVEEYAAVLVIAAVSLALLFPSILISALLVVSSHGFSSYKAGDVRHPLLSNSQVQICTFL